MRWMISTLFLTILLVGMSTAQTGSDAQTSTTTAAPAQADTPPPVKKKAKHVFTNDDVKAADPKDIPTAPSASAGYPDSTAPATPASSKENKTAKTDKKTAKPPTKEQIAAAQAKVDSLKDLQQGLTGVVANIQRLIAEQPGRAQSMGDGLTHNQNDLAETNKKLAAAQQELDALKSAGPK